jgi:EAL domain-containing protein (putative c-di-GMP-specific phosphodiesterase class I)
MMEDTVSSSAMVERLRDLGIGIHVDDFGTGYSSLHLLSSLEPDEVKIDKSFVMAMRSDDLARQIVRMVAGMAPSMGMEIVAEGVDDANTLAQLEELGVHRFQGYLFSRALTVSDLLARCTSSSEGLQLHPSDPGPAMAAPQAG